jgi:hypothetical protein
MKFKACLALFTFALLMIAPVGRARVPQQKDYLTALEADKIRNAENDNNERIKLFLSFAEDRLKKFQYELEHPSSNRHADMLNSLLNAYVGCVDDAADLMQLGIEKQENIRKGIDLMAARTKEFLAVLEKLSTDGPEREIYKENLDDAIEGTRDAMNDAERRRRKSRLLPSGANTDAWKDCCTGMKLYLSFRACLLQAVERGFCCLVSSVL